jgi:hypothetical protein
MYASPPRARALLLATLLSFAVAAYGDEEQPGRSVFRDTRVAWHPIETLEVSLVGQNLNQERHVEFGGAQGAAPSEIERSFYGKLTWHY